MNIFHLSDSPYLAAQWQHDRHVVKMTLETCQLLSTAVWHNPTIRAYWEAANGPLREGIDHVDAGGLRLYRSISNPNHPSAVWVRESLANFAWTVQHLDGLISEYHRRFRKVHGCDAVRWSFLRVVCAIVEAPRAWTRDDARRLILDPRLVALANQHTPFNMSMPDEYRIKSDPVEAYRNLYRGEKIFQDHVKWTRCDSLPNFISECAPLYPEHASKVQQRVAQLIAAHESGIVAAQAPRDPHPDTLKAPNPKAILRFGARA